MSPKSWDTSFVAFGREGFVVRGEASRRRFLAQAARKDGRVVEFVEGRTELLVVVGDPRDRSAVVRDLQSLRHHGASQRAQSPVTHLIGVHYDGPDLEETARALGLSGEGLVALHTEAAYGVLAIGFQVGFAYLGPLPPALRLPRRATPRPRVPAGSVAIAADQTAVYPHASPGGWHLIGTTDFRCFDPDAAELTPFRVGDRVRFRKLGTP